MTYISIDDYPLSREGLMAILGIEEGFEFVGQASSVKEARDIILQVQPDMVIVDLKLKDEYGLDIVSEIKKLGISCKFIVLTSSVDPEDFKRANELSVEGYILKDAMPEEIINAIRLIIRGRKYYDPGIIEIITKKENLDNVEQLTTREREVLAALGEGLNNKAIAKRLFITECTVKKHVSQILGKLGLSCRTQAALYASTRGIVNQKCFMKKVIV